MVMTTERPSPSDEGSSEARSTRGAGRRADGPAQASRQDVHRARRRGPGLLILLLVVALATVGVWVVSHRGSDAPAPSSVDHPQGTVQSVPALGSSAINVRNDVHLTSCTLTSGKVAAKGTVKNTEKTARDLVIAAQWLPLGSGDTIGLGVWTARDVPAGKTVSWSATATIPVAADRCILLAQSALTGTLK